MDVNQSRCRSEGCGKPKKPRGQARPNSQDAVGGLDQRCWMQQLISFKKKIGNHQELDYKWRATVERRILTLAGATTNQ